MKLPNFVSDTIQWTLKHPIHAIAIIYTIVCLIDLFAPIATSRGSWWNLIALALRLITTA